MWNRLHHPNIAKFYGISFQLGGRPSLVMQWYENGAAPDYLSSRPNERRLDIVSLRLLHFISTLLRFIVLHLIYKGQGCLSRFEVFAHITVARGPRRSKRRRKLFSSAHLISDSTLPSFAE